MAAEQSNGRSQENGDASTRPLRVIIIGAGIGGLALAVMLRRNGHDVQIYERSRFARELGAAVSMAPNAHGLFKSLGIDLAATGANEVQYIREYTPSGALNREVNAGRSGALWQHSWMLAHRVRLHDALKEKATAAEGLGPPCTLHLNSAVVSIDADTATITLKDGTTAKGDVVVGADGVHSQARRQVPSGKDAHLVASGKSAFRFLVQREDAVNDDRAKTLVDRDGLFTLVIGSDRRIIMYPTSANTLLNFVCIHPESESEAGEDWDTSTNRETLLKVYRDFAPEFTAILSKADPESLKLWKLWDMKNLPAFHHSCLALIGDAAHPFLPHQGQGASMAVEDAVALGTVLEHGLTADEVPERLELYNQIRYGRACQIQQYTRLAGLDVQDNKLDTIEYAKYNFGHDETHNSAQKLREWKWQRLPKPAFKMLTAFGPCSSVSLRNPRSKPLSGFQSTVVRFKTSKTLMQNFFPPSNTKMFFATPGTVATCSFVQTTFKNMDWLASGGYNTLSLYVHGVAYQAAQQQKIQGVYVPIIFEDLPDAVTRDREWYALPATFAGIRVQHTAKALEISASIGGLDWAKITLNNLQPNTSPVDPSTDSAILPDDARDLGLLTWKSATRFDTQQDDLAIRLLFDKEDPTLKVQETWQTTDISIQLGLQDKNVPPTMSHVLGRLSEIPIYQVLDAKVVSGTGSPSFAHVERLI